MRPLAGLLLAVLLPALPLSAGDNLLDNGGFEEDEIGHLAMWSMDAFTHTDAAVRFFTTTQEKHSGNRALAIANLEPNDARAVQWVKVKPGTHYRLSCWVLAQGIETEQIGANISVLGITGAAGDLTDTGGRWVPVELYGRTASGQQALGVLMRVGFYGSLARGVALFDDVRLEELPGPPPGVAAERILNLGTEEPQARIVAAEQTPPPPAPARSLADLFTPTVRGLLLAVLTAAALILLGSAAARWIASKARHPAHKPKVTIEDLVYGYGVPAGLHLEASAFSLRGRRRHEDTKMEHRRTPRAPFPAPVTVRRVRGAGRIEYLKLQGENVSDGGLFLVSADLSVLGLDEEVGIEIPTEDRTVDLGKAVVTRVQSRESGRGGARRGRGGFGLRFLLPPYRIHRLRQALGRGGVPAAPSGRVRLPAPAEPPAEQPPAPPV